MRFKNLQLVKTSIIPATVFAHLPYWQALTSDEQKKVERETQDVAFALIMEGTGKLQQGLHLLELRRILEGKGVFVRHLQLLFRKMSVKTAYRRIAQYENARRKFSEPLVKAIMARGLDLVGDTDKLPYGKYTPIIRQLPPPKSEDKQVISEWLDRVEEAYKKRRSDIRTERVIDYDSVHPPTDALIRAAFRHVRIKFRKIPPNHRSRALKELFGYLLAEFDGSGVHVSPVEAPADFRRGPGKPKTIEAK
jgi:hypothetical protein